MDILKKVNNFTLSRPPQTGVCAYRRPTRNGRGGKIDGRKIPQAKEIFLPFSSPHLTMKLLIGMRSHANRGV